MSKAPGRCWTRPRCRRQPLRPRSSSLAAREPKLSMYGASKARSEQHVLESAMDLVIVRPPAVYGPGDKETLDLFKMAKRGFVLLPPKGRLSVIHVDDLGLLLLQRWRSQRHRPANREPDDGRPDGMESSGIRQRLGRGEAFGRNTINFSAPSALIRMGATIDRWLRGDGAKLTPDRASYFCHPGLGSGSGADRAAGYLARRNRHTAGRALTPARWYEDGGWL